METIPVEQIIIHPLLSLALVLVAYLVIIFTGITIIRRKSSPDITPSEAIKRHAIFGVISAITIIILYAGTAFAINSINTQNLSTAVTEANETLSDEQLTELMRTGTVMLDAGKTILFSDEGTEHQLTVFDPVENAKQQSELDKNSLLEPESE